MEIDELAKFASEAGEKMKNLEPVTSDVDTIVEQLHDYKVDWFRCVIFFVIVIISKQI